MGETNGNHRSIFGMRSTAGALGVAKSAKILTLLLTVALLFGGTAVGVVNAQASPNGKYDTDGDGLIEVNNLEQLSAIRYDLDGDGSPDSGDAAEAYAAAFTTSGTEVVCAGNCAGYELFRSLDFDDADSYASGMVDTVLISGDGWHPIGARTGGFNTTGFDATFDGNEHTISNLFIDRSGSLNNPGAAGLFGAVGQSGVVRKIGLVDVDVSGVGYVGGLVGVSGGSISDSHATGAVTGNHDYVGGLAGSNVGSISDSHATGAVTGSRDYVGGLVGVNSISGTISGSRATGAVTGSRDHVGGLAGSNRGGSISGSHATGAVTGDRDYVGGLAGSNRGSGTISTSYATGAVIGDDQVGGLVGRNLSSISGSHATGTVNQSSSNNGAIGGLVGYNHGSISDSYAAVGGVMGSSPVGGLVGSNDGTISFSHATGAVSGSIRVGGLAGRNGGTISFSHATGAVSGSRNSVGGLAGVNTSDGTISGSHATGAVMGSSLVGGLAGSNSSGGTIIASYATGTVTGSSFSTYVGGLAGSSNGTISTSYATGAVMGHDQVGGLVGSNFGSIGGSYATGAVSGGSNVGGLIGRNSGVRLVGASYAVGRVSGDANVGGLIGSNTGQVTAGFWDSQTSGQGTGVGDGEPTGAVGKTTAELQGPTGYTGIYSAWLIDLDDADRDRDPETGIDQFWDFGTSSQYPALKADFDGDGTATWQEFGSQRPGAPISDQAGMVTLSTMRPVVGAGLTATLSDPDGAVTGVTWQWARSVDGTTGWADIPGATSMSYTPMSVDVGHHLRATATYTDPLDSGRTAMAMSDHAVTAGDPLVVRYDADGNGTIEKSEVIKAINDYLFGEGDEAISKSDVIKLINLYLFGPS